MDESFSRSMRSTSTSCCMRPDKPWWLRISCAIRRCASGSAESSEDRFARRHYYRKTALFDRLLRFDVTTDPARYLVQRF
jgi:hypothetical protein